MLSVFSVVHILNVHACRRAYIHHMQYIASRCNYIYILYSLETFEMYVSDVCQVYFFLVYVQCASIVSGWWFGTFFHILGIVIPSDELIFFKMVKTTNQVCNDEFFLSVPRQWSGPVFIKLGQWLSTRRDIIPSHFLLAKSPRSRRDFDGGNSPSPVLVG